MLELNSNSRELVIGFVYLGLSASQIPMFCLVIMAVHKIQRQEPNMTYKLINLIQCSQVVQTICHFLTSFLLIFPAFQRFPFIIGVIGATVGLFYSAELPTMALLAVCRVLIFTGVIKTKKTPLGVKLFLLSLFSVLTLIFLYSSAHSLIFFSPPSMDYNISDPFSPILGLFDFYISILSLIIAYISYLAIVYLIYMASLSALYPIHLYVLKSKKAVCVKSKREELSILVQYTIAVGYTTGSLIFWHEASLDMKNFEVRAAINISWIVGSYVYPVVILICNKTVREKSICILGLRSEDVRPFTTNHSSIGAPPSKRH
ncbi:unnamed protein product [Caenorhabditis sp. 36 PRJEB53466]|nr:unnamed protein product [Caenorhabditis sp. 36 PRJEB53466]